jgi:hypothetical protein
MSSYLHQSSGHPKSHPVIPGNRRPIAEETSQIFLIIFPLLLYHITSPILLTFNILLSECLWWSNPSNITPNTWVAEAASQDILDDSVYTRL